MADNKVARSIEAPGGLACIDIFQRPDGSWGFEEYRRDAEDPRGWFAVGHFAGQSFTSLDAACRAACKAVVWLDDVAN